jgi:signal transduction histidine kinase
VSRRPSGPRRGGGGPPWAGERPEWWPADEPWPPRRWPPRGWPSRRRPRPWRGFGCLFAFLFLIGVLGLASIAASVVGGVMAAPGLAGHLIRLTALLVTVAVVAAVVRAGSAIRGSGVVLDELVDQAGRVESGDYTARVDVTGPASRPVRDLVRGFNTMAARLEADEAQRRSLLADVSHELRTPLTVIAGNVEAILDGVHPADAAHLEAILEETRVLSRLVEDLRTLALSEAGSLSLHREPTDLDVLCTEVATSFAATAEAAGVNIETAVDDDVPLVDVDPVRIREVLGNLVSNAIRHTPSGGRVWITARPGRPAGRGGGGADRDGGDGIELLVRDTGPGIDPALLPHVFERFARGQGSTGTGLGLSIARGLIELHGGTISAHSPAGGGTEIRIQLPVGPD